MKHMALLAMGLTALSFTLGAAAARAQESDDARYYRLLGAVSKQLEIKRLRTVPGARLTTRAISVLKLEGKFYQAGQSWAVRFEPSADPAMAAMVRKEVSAVGVSVSRQPSIFDFKVVDVVADGNARIEVRERLGDGINSASPRVDHFVLELNRQFVPVKKEIYYRDARRPIALTLDSGNTFFGGFEAAPIDLPNLKTDDGLQTRDADGTPSLEFQSEDTYARPVRALWREGELWPARIVSTAGTAVLLK